MVALLVIDPSRLADLSGTISSNYWQTFSNLALVITALLWIGLLLFKPKARWQPLALQNRHNLSAPASAVASIHSVASIPSIHPVPNVTATHTAVVLTPLFVLGQHGIWRLILQLLCVLLVLVAVVGNTLAQRMAVIALAPTHDIYVDAIVTPDGLSDKRLQQDDANQVAVNSADNRQGAKVVQPATAKPQVLEGYRQLVTLTHIQPATTASLTEGSLGIEDNNGKAKPVTPVADNPFLKTPSNLTTTLPPSAVVLGAQPPPSKLATVVTDTPDQMPKQMTVMLATFKADAVWLNAFAPNQQVKMRLKLSPLEINNNRHEFNEYRWLSTRHAVATAQIVEVDKTQLHRLSNLSLWQSINQFRYQLRQHFLALQDEQFAKVNAEAALNTNSGLTGLNKTESLDDANELNEKADAIAVTLSLLTGDRSLISKELNGLYRFAGISHLLAISGAHVLFLAILSASLVTMLANRFWLRLYRVVPRWQVRFAVAVLVAFAYALFAGFDVPAMRTAWMLLIVGLLRYLLVSTSVYKLLLLLAVGMAWQDVFVLWQAGFWLSFVAVAMLIVYSQSLEANQLTNQLIKDKKTRALRKTPSPAVTHTVTLKRLLWTFFKVQLWMSVALLPISLWLFGKVSLWGFMVNLVAIGLFGWVIVPLDLLAGLLYVVTPTSLGIADGVWQVIFWLLRQFHHLLLWLQSSMGQLGWLYNDIDVATLMLLLLVLLPWWLPKRILSRVLALPAFVTLCLHLVMAEGGGQYQQDPAKNITHLTVLDTANAKVTALLLSHEHQHWLLLSLYPSSNYAKLGTANSVAQSGLSAQQVKQLTQTLYDDLQVMSIPTLTGVVGQTATPDIAKVVAGLRHDMPISYYWQAGLSADKLTVQAALQGLSLSAQDCGVGKVWSPAPLTPVGSLGLHHDNNDANAIKNNNIAPSLVLTAVTGWPKINDKTVWDCTLQLNSAYPVLLTQTTALGQKAETIALAKAGEGVVVYGSRYPRLASLWQLMCPSPATVQTAASRQHWLFTVQAQINTASIDKMPPLSWHTVHQPNQPIAANVTEAKLYWQQQYANPK